MGAAVSVRGYRPADAPALIRLAAEMAADIDEPPPALTPALLAAATDPADPWCAILVATLDDHPAGFAVTTRRFEAHMARRSLWLADLHVAAAARRHGVATALMAAVGRAALAEGCALVAWDLWTKNQRARAFYDRIGARVDGELLVVSAGARALAALA